MCTGKKPRRLNLTHEEAADVFLVSGSPEERNTFIGEIVPELPEDGTSIVLCSMQYRPDVTQTIDFFLSNGFDLKLVWLNPGYQQPTYVDDLGLVPYVMERGAWIAMRDGADLTGAARTFASY